MSYCVEFKVNRYITAVAGVCRMLSADSQHQTTKMRHQIIAFKSNQHKSTLQVFLLQRMVIFMPLLDKNEMSPKMRTEEPRPPKSSSSQHYCRIVAQGCRVERIYKRRLLLFFMQLCWDELMSCRYLEFPDFEQLYYFKLGCYNRMLLLPSKHKGDTHLQKYQMYCR